MKPAITDIPGIGPAAAAALGEHKITSVARLAGASVETISAVPGFSEARATRVISAAAELLAASGTPQSAKVKPEQSGEVEKPENKGKKEKKDKKKKDKGKRKGKGKKKDKKKKDKK
ncbi:MAG: helix-hairpin-helix domain-containing protein [Gammaproteobacteria bacterium]|jgi:ribosomal protein L12E/L44/L45/RPP1/RPP2|nr:helix-hairpin-helix domain-containing protein [Gammaproteobacteria bacterium]